MSDNSISRTHYFEGQFLRTQDFVDEQAYHVAMRRRHNISHHTWGIVSGLELVLEEGNFFVQPGLAVDGYGRELILPQKKPLSSSAFIDKGSNELDVWLTYGLTSSDEAPSGYAGCGNGNSNGASFYRWQETANVLLAKPADSPDRRLPQDIALSDRDFNATRTPPDGPESSWPVFLGQIIKDPANQQEPLAVRSDDRPYVGLVGESITAPSGRARVQVGSELANDPNRFAVFTRDDNAPQPRNWLPRFEIDVDGEVTVRGDASVEGNLVIAGGAVEFEATNAVDNRAYPWTIYRTADGTTNQLRIEMAAAAGLQKSEVVIGAWFKGPDATGQEKEMFHPCLTIRDDCSVEVGGNLVVKGTITADKVIEGQLSVAASNFAASALASGILSTTGRLPGLPGSATNVVSAAVVPASVDTIVNQLETDEAFRDEFIKKMADSQVLSVSPKP